MKFKIFDNGQEVRITKSKLFLLTNYIICQKYADEIDRNYSFHWQDKNENLIVRWDNAPHHSKIATFPHHKHDKHETIVESTEITAKEVLEIIQTKVTSQ